MKLRGASIRNAPEIDWTGAARNRAGDSAMNGNKGARRFAVRGLPDAFASGPAGSLSADVISTGWKTRSVVFHGMETSLHRQSFSEDDLPLESAKNAAGMESAFRGATAFSSQMRPGRGTHFLSPSVRAAENVIFSNNEPHNATINP